MTRDAFREAVFARDRHRCVHCGELAQDAHHIMERRLFADGGYDIDNGASLCGACHLLAESTELSCETIREAAGIHRLVLPEHLYPDERYDKWGNPFLPNGMRLRGELFHDPSVQKILVPVLDLFTHWVKYPRTYHLPFSPGVNKDDRVIKDLSPFVNKEVVITLKMDGENTTMYSDFIHARALSYHSEPGRNRIKALHASLCADIPTYWRICGENLCEKHAIHYRHLPDWFLVFSIWNAENWCLSWDETLEWCELLGLKSVPVLWRGIFDLDVVQNLHQPERGGDLCEGFVVRLANAFHYREFKSAVAKYVRAGHVPEHARNVRRRPFIPNQLES